MNSNRKGKKREKKRGGRKCVKRREKWRGKRGENKRRGKKRKGEQSR